MRYRVHDAISAGSGKGERALSGSDGLVIRAHHVEME
jgi:hypothetical protein